MLGLPTLITNCSNNYGPWQHKEKLVPKIILNAINNIEIPIYGDGENIRDWLYVEDHARAIDLIYHQAENFETYNIGGFNEWKNIDLIKLLCNQMDKKLNKKPGTSEQLIVYVKDRLGHDRRYAIDASKIQKELCWEPSVNFEEGLSKTIDWYLANDSWLENIKSGSYKQLVTPNI